MPPGLAARTQGGAGGCVGREAALGWLWLRVVGDGFPQRGLLPPEQPELLSSWPRDSGSAASRISPTLSLKTLLSSLVLSKRLRVVISLLSPSNICYSQSVLIQNLCSAGSRGGTPALHPLLCPSQGSACMAESRLGGAVQSTLQPLLCLKICSSLVARTSVLLSQHSCSLPHCSEGGRHTLRVTCVCRDFEGAEQGTCRGAMPQVSWQLPHCFLLLLTQRPRPSRLACVSEAGLSGAC